MRPTRRPRHHLLRRILDLLEIHKRLRAHLLRELLPLGAGVHHDRPHPHRRRELHALDANTAAAAGETRPLARADARCLQRGVRGGGAAHHGARDVITHPVGDECRVARGGADVLLIGAWSRRLVSLGSWRRPSTIRSR